MKISIYMLLAALLLIIVPGHLHADQVSLRNGQTVTGTIVEEREAFVIIESPTAGRLRFDRAQVNTVSRSPAGASAAAGSGTATADAERQRGNLAGALSAYLKSAADPAREATVAPQFKATFDELLQRGKGYLQNRPDQARADLTVLYEVLRNPATANLLGGSQEYSRRITEVGQELGKASATLADRMKNNPSLRPQALSLLREAVVATGGNNLDYRLAYADAAREAHDYKNAFESLKAIVESPAASDEIKQTAYERLSRVASASGGEYVLARATPVPSTPVPVSGTPWPGQVTGPTLSQQTPAPSGPPQPKWKQLLTAATSSETWGEVGKFVKPLLSEEYLPFLIAIPLAILLLWVLPFQFLKFRAKRGDGLAGDLLYPSKRYGAVMLLPYLFKTASRPRAKNRCPFCGKGIDNIDQYSDLNFVVCPHCREPITPIYDMRDYVDHLIGQLKLSQKRNKGDALIEKDAMLKLVRGVLALSIRRRASDIHIETMNEGGKIRARIDGIMYELLMLPREISPAFISAIKVMATLDITERRIPQDGKISFWLDQEDYDLRINTSPAAMGEKAVIRILCQNSINVDPAKLGLEGNNLVVYERNISKPHGVVIVTGPSGSGKSTTLYVALNELNNGEKNIVTIEDPIEYKLKGLSQMQVNPAANFTFANGLRSILRQDPDVIMVGEIRDKETAEAALDAAMTGHLVLTTLHTIDAPTAFSRMKDLGIDQARVSNAVNLIIAQRLVRTICSDCRKTYKPKPADLETLGLKESDGVTYVHGAGCDTCMNTGYQGRLAIFEMLENDEELRALLETNQPATIIRDNARSKGMKTLREAGIDRIKAGVTTVEEVIRVTT